MRYIRFLLTVLLLCLGMGARADNIVSVSSAQGAPGEEVSVSISLANSDAVASLQVSIPLDENLTLVEESSQLGSRCGNHSLTVGVNDGILQVFVYSITMAAITGNSGEVATFRLKLGNQPKTCSLTPSKTILTNSDGEAVSSSAEGGAVTCLCAKAELDMAEVDFGEVPIRSTYTKTISVTNTGNADLVINSMTFSDVNVFSTTTELPLTISPGASRGLNVTYAPVERGTIERTLKVDCNSSSKLSAIKLKAKPFAVNELHIQPVSGISDEEVTISMTMNNMDAISGYQVDFNMPEQLAFVDGSFSLSDRKQDHESIVSLKDNVLRIIVFSQGDKPLTGNDGEIGSFRVKIVGRNSVKLTPSKTVLSATIGQKVDNVVSAVYGGTVTISSPNIYTSSTTLAFGAVSLTETAEKVLLVRNSGYAPLTISRVVFDSDDFSVKESLPVTIGRNGSQNLTVVCQSLKEGSFETTMKIYSNDPEQRMKEVKVTGSRFAPNYLSVETPDIFAHENLPVCVTVNNYSVISGLQFDLTYPEGYEPFDDNYTVESRAAGMTVTWRQMDESTLRVFCYFLSEGNINAGSGKVTTLLLRPKEGVVPEGSYSVSVTNIKMGTSDMTDRYAGTNASSSFQTTLDPTLKCATPTISFDDGKIEFHSETVGVKFESELTSDDVGKKSTDEVNLKGKITVTVYATKPGYQNSDAVTAELPATGKYGDINNDGKVTMTDAIIVVDTILKDKE